MKDIEDPYEMGSIYISSEQIIQEVQKFKCLYDPADPDHKDRDVMRDAWLSVSQAVVGEPWEKLNDAERNEAEKDLKKKWKDMRDCFVKDLKKQNNRSTGKTQVIRKRKPYIHNERLSFLLETDHYKGYVADFPVPTISSVAEIPPSSAETVGPEETKRSQAATRAGDFDGRPKHEYRILRTEKNKKNSSRPFNLTVQKDSAYEREDSSTSCHSSFSVPHHNPEPENPDRMFLLSLLPRVSALNSRDKMDFQIGIMQLLQGYEAEDSSS